MEPDDNSFKGSKQLSIDEFFIDDDPIQTSKSMQGSSHLTRMVQGSNINDHSECQEHLRMQRQKMEQKDFEISKCLLYMYTRPLLGINKSFSYKIKLCFFSMFWYFNLIRSITSLAWCIRAVFGTLSQWSDGTGPLLFAYLLSSFS